MVLYTQACHWTQRISICNLLIYCSTYVSLRKLAMLQARVSLVNCFKAFLLFSLFLYDRSERVVGKWTRKPPCALVVPDWRKKRSPVPLLWHFQTLFYAIKFISIALVTHKPHSSVVLGCVDASTRRTLLASRTKSPSLGCFASHEELSRG